MAGLQDNEMEFLVNVEHEFSNANDSKLEFGLRLWVTSNAYELRHRKLTTVFNRVRKGLDISFFVFFRK